ncbi:MAG: glycosyltransferase family 1 protein, partial [Tissierellia bacterium]|nr:glycosyltransferase family 1 protein [Tissierellia bacterium]
MKIALVTETFLPSTDGVVTRLTNAVDYMVGNGHEVIIICPDIEGIEEEYNG